MSSSIKYGNKQESFPTVIFFSYIYIIHFLLFAQGLGIIVCKVYGKIYIRYSLNEINSGCDILVATPGRLLNYIQTGKIRLMINELRAYSLTI
jgi:superfamily II DNA/RNA helicase